MHKKEQYALLCAQAEALVQDSPALVCSLSNLAALLYSRLEDVNWAGFYLARGEELVLGPFGGLPACMRIPFAKGVCGAAATRRETVVVPDVHAFPGHIACDCASRSEIVLPLLRDGRLLGVLDIDSPLPARFDGQDAEGLAPIAQLAAQLNGWDTFQHG